MDLTIALCQVVAFLLLGLALPMPRLRPAAVVVLIAVAILGSVVGALAEGSRSLTTVHTYAGFEGLGGTEITMVRFPTGTLTAPAWQWPLPFLGFALFWVAVLITLGGRLPRRALPLSLLFSWTGLATWLGMQYLAAPEEIVQPVGIDRVLWPAGLALALLAARRARSMLLLFVTVGSGILLGRLPAALFSKYASDHELGSVLDIHSIRDIVNPMNQMQFEPRLVAGSSEQQFWLIWLEHVIFFPGVYFLSVFGIAFGAYMFFRHGDGDPAAPIEATPA